MIAPRVKSVQVLRPYVVRVVFDDGAVREVDMEPVLRNDAGGTVFEPLLDPDLFAQVEVEKDGRTTICWPTQADIDPEVLYGIAKSDMGPGPRVRIPQKA